MQSQYPKPTLVTFKNELMKIAMKKIILSLITILSFNAAALAQKSDSIRPIAKKFNNLIESSNTFKGYKVVDQQELTALQEDTQEYIQKLKLEIEQTNQAAEAQLENVASLEAELANIKGQLEQVKAEKDSIEFLGMPLEKSTFKSVMWGIIAVLVLALSFFVYRFKQGHSTTLEARKRLEETEKELEAFKVRALEKEQKLGRMLQDERNRHAQKAV